MSISVSDPLRPPLAVTMGDPAGIGGEITLKAWKKGGLPPFFLIDDADRLARLSASLGLDVPIARIANPGQAAEGLAVLHRPLPKPPVPGKPDPDNAPAILASIAEAVTFAREGRAAAVVTNPIHKEGLYRTGFAYPGHTEYLAALCGVPDVVMMLACPQLKVVPLTIHVSLQDAIAALDEKLIMTAAKIVAAAMQRDFGIAAPRLAFAGLNPHAGEGGSLGEEDGSIIAPALAKLREIGIDASGPWPADTLFHAEARAGYDVAFGMYHDQALIPIKTLDFHGGVNVTLGLPIIRTSPDHGTAFDIAGTGKAQPESLIASMNLAWEMAGRHV
jgi:4-hydroxythreonine-4-phosphate dehydrogenase